MEQDEYDERRGALEHEIPGADKLREKRCSAGRILNLPFRKIKGCGSSH